MALMSKLVTLRCFEVRVNFLELEDCYLGLLPRFERAPSLPNSAPSFPILSSTV